MADKQNVQLRLPQIPASADAELQGWWREVQVQLDQVLVQLIGNVNDHVDGRFRLIILDILTEEPAEIEDGMIVNADGLGFNPGAGAGTYERKAGAWSKL